MKNIYIDTNFFLIPGQFGVDIFEEIKKACDFPYELKVLSTTIAELNKIINEQKGKQRDAAKLGIGLVSQKIKEKSLYITTFSSEGNVDDILVKLASKDNIIATQDKELKKRVKQKGGQVLILRNKKYLEIV